MDRAGSRVQRATDCVLFVLREYGEIVRDGGDMSSARSLSWQLFLTR